MTDLFEDKAADWDASAMRAGLSAAVGEAVIERVPLDADMDVMDFGAGTGLLAGHVAPKVGRVVAVDISASMLEALSQKTELSGVVEPRCQDILETPLEERFDLIVSAMAMHHVEGTDALLTTFHDHLHPGGHVALADLDAEDGSFHPPGTEGVYHHGFAREALATRLERAGFEDIAFTTAHTIEREGDAYPVFLVTATRPS